MRREGRALTLDTAQERGTVVVVGTGSAGMRHLEALNAMPAASVIAVPMRQARREALAREGWKTARGIDEAAALGASACVVATEPSAHVNEAMAALACGLDVLIEKPMAPSASEASAITRRARELKRQVFVGCVLRFSAAMAAVRRWLPDIGRIHAVRIECRSYLPDWRPARPYHDSYSARKEEGGVLRDMIHEIDYAGWLFGWPEALQARALNLGRLGIASEELAELSWQAPSGAVVSLGLDYVTRSPRRWMAAHGERGTVTGDLLSGAVSLWVNGSLQERNLAQPRQAWFREQMEAFLRAGAEATDDRLARGEEGIRALAVCDAARRASLSRREERVESP